MTINGQQIMRVKDFARHPYTWPGAYPCFAVTPDGGVLCAACVKNELVNIVTAIAQNLRDGWKVESIEINWEDPELYCDHCNKQIEPAYGEN